MMKNRDYTMNLLEAVKDKRPLIMDLGDKVFLHMKWEESIVTPDGEKGCYVDEIGMTSMKLILKIIKGEVEIKGKKIEIRIEEI